MKKRDLPGEEKAVQNAGLQWQKPCILGIDGVGDVLADCVSGSTASGPAVI